MKRRKTPDQIKEELYNISRCEMRSILEFLKEAKEVSKELKIIERGRKVEINISEAIKELEQLRLYLDDYPLEKEVSSEPVPWA